MFTKATLFILTVFICLPLTDVASQTLDIYYNLFNDSVTYKKDGKILDKPKLKRGGEIHLHVTEFNNFIYEIELDVNQYNAQENMGFADFSQLLPGMPPLVVPGESMGDPGTGGETHEGVDLLDMPMMTINDNPLTLRSLFQGSRGGAELLDQANESMQEIKAIIEETGTIKSEIKEIDRAVGVSQMAAEDIARYEYNPNLKPSDIKKRCEEYYTALYRKTPGETISLDDLLMWEEVPTQYAMNYNRLQKKSKELDEKVGFLSLLITQLNAYEFESLEYRKYTKDLLDFKKKAQEFTQELKSATSGEIKLPDFPTRQQLTDLQFELAEILSSEFTYHARVQATSDIVNINIKVVKKPDDSTMEKVVVQSRYLNMNATGGLKISASLGMNFGQYFSPGQSYSVKNNLIVGENDGSFVPVATSFMHFYSYNGGKVSLGGSFGLGFPLTGGSENQSLQFFFGPSFIFGASQRLVISGGIMGGRVSRLARGYKVGDEFDNLFGDIPTRNPYELGFFVGTSFNMGGK